MEKNLLKEFINDEQYVLLNNLGFLNYHSIRNYYIRKKFSALKTRKKPKEIFAELRQEFPYLAVESIRKIAYTKVNSRTDKDT